MIRPSKEVLEHLFRLKNDSVLMQWLVASEQKCVSEIVMQQDEALLRQAQGRAQVLREFLEYIQYERKPFKE